MRKFEYKAVPAPKTGTKAKGIKAIEDRFSLSMTDALNDMADDGWEYVRAETLPCDERKGLTGTQTTYQNILIFRRLETPAEVLSVPSITERPVTKPTLSVETSERPISEPVTPRRVSSMPTSTGTAPPLGSARDE